MSLVKFLVNVSIRKEIRTEAGLIRGLSEDASGRRGRGAEERGAGGRRSEGRRGGAESGGGGFAERVLAERRGRVRRIEAALDYL